MAEVTLVQGTFANPGTSSSDNFYFNFSKTASQSYLFGTYTIDSNNLGGSDTLVFKATDIFNGINSAFFPKFELTPGTNFVAWTAYDQRATPLRVEWNSFSPSTGDNARIELWMTPTGSTAPVLAATINNTGTYIGRDGMAATNERTGAMFVRENITEYAGYTGILTDQDSVNLGQFYVNDDALLHYTSLISNFDGTSVTSLAAGAFDKFIFNEINNQSYRFTGSDPIEAIQVDVTVDSGALDSGRRYMNLAGSIGAPTPGNSWTNFTSVVPDVEYNLSVDLGSLNGLTVKETDTGRRNWWDSVAYSDIGITADGKSGYVNNGGTNIVNPTGVTLTTGSFSATGTAFGLSNVSYVDTSTSFINVGANHGFAAGDKLLFQSTGPSAGQLDSGNTYVVTQVNGNQIKVAYENNPTSAITFGPGFQLPSGSTFQKLGGYDATVLRNTVGATDVYGGFESFTLTTGDDTINFNGANNLSVNAGRGSDTWNIAAKDAQNAYGWNQLEIYSGSKMPGLSGETTGLFVNLSGESKTAGGVTLSSSWNAGQMRDSYGTVDNFNIRNNQTDPNAGYTDNVHLTFDTTTFSDRFYLAADGFGTFSEYRILGSGGFDQYHLSSAINSYSLAPTPVVTSSNLNGLIGGMGNATVEQSARFFDASDFKISFATTGSGSSQKLSATLYDTTQISNTSANGDINVIDAAGWSVGDTVIYRAGAGSNTVTGLTDGTRYTVSAVTGNTVRLQTTSGLVNPITTADMSTMGSSLDHIVSTAGVVDGVYSGGAVNGGFVTFADDPGQFSRLTIRVDGKITDQTTLAFNAQTNVPSFTANQDFWVNDLSSSQGHAAFSIDYRDLYDGQPASVNKSGILYVNGIVDKGALGFDRLVDYQESAYVGARSYSMTDYADTLIQSTGSSSVELMLTAGAGQDKVFIEGFSGDPNQRIELNLGDSSWGSRDNEFDKVEIGLSRLNKSFDSVQYIDVTNADSNDSIKFVDAAGYNIVKSMEAGSVAGSYTNYATYKVYEGSTSSAGNLVMQVRVTGDQNLSGTNQYFDLTTNTNWGQVTNGPRSVAGNPTAVAMTANADSALLFEDTTTSPYLMGDGNDYVVTMGGDQDIALGAGNDFLSIRNTGQQLFASGGAGFDQLGMGGSWSRLSDGSYVSDQWSFGSIEVAKAKEIMAEKYPLLPATTDPFAWDSGPLDRVMVATNRLDGTTVYFQSEELSFSNGSVNSGNFLPPISETYDTTARSLAYTTLYGRSTNDTVNLKVANVDEALKHIATWLNSTTVAPITTGSVLVGSHALEIAAQTATGPQWFTGNSAVTNGGFKLVDIENIRLFDNGGKEVTVRVAGSSSYDSVDQALQYANRGDVLFVAETKEGALTGTTRAAVNMDTTVFVSGGMRVAFEEGANRTVNTTAQLVVNMTGDIKTSATNSGFFGTNANALEVLGSANINVNGSAIGDIIVGNKGNNVINGLTGNDVVFGGNGSDMLIGSIGDDILIGGSSHRVAALQHSPYEGVFTGFDLTTDTFRINSASTFELQTGDKVIYKATGGSGIAAAGVALTEASPLYVIRIDDAGSSGGVNVKLANSLANAKAGVALDITSNGTSTTTHGVTLDNVAYTAANLAGSDYLYGGSGHDHLIATGVTGSLSVAGVRDTLTMNGGSGNDTFSLFGNSGKVNMFGGSGSDKVEIFDNFLDVTGVNKSARVVDFAASQDDISSTFSALELGTTTVEARLTTGAVTLSQLVSPPLPIVSGSAENGNYQETNEATIATYGIELDGYQFSIADLVNLHQAHAA